MTEPRPAWQGLPDVASRALGGSVVGASDEFFADVHSLIAAGPAQWDPSTYGPRGKVYDGWETRRRREPGDDWVIVRLAAPAVVRGVIVDTAYFTGNYPPAAALDGATVLGYPSAADLAAADWSPLAPKAGLRGDHANELAVAGPDRLVTHVRLTIYPDGGVARLRVHGEVVPDPRWLGGRPDLAALLAGGQVADCSNMFYASPANVLSPGRARVMSDGWETSRRRDDGNDWLVVRLAAPGVLHEAVIDTSRFVGNAPGRARLTDAETGAELLPETRLVPDTEHRFRLAAAPPARLVRLDIYPDGGISRLRLPGVIPAAGRGPLAERWLSLLPPARPPPWTSGTSSLERRRPVPGRAAAQPGRGAGRGRRAAAAPLPGPPAGRQPVHTCYVPAGQFTAGTARQWGDPRAGRAGRARPAARLRPGRRRTGPRQAGPRAGRGPADRLRGRVRAAHRRRGGRRRGGRGPGAGQRGGGRDRAAVLRPAGEVPGGHGPPPGGPHAGPVPGHAPCGRRRPRAAAPPPPGFRITLPKVTSVAQVAAMAGLCAALEAEYALPRLDLELQVETPQAVLGPDGTALVAPMLAAADGRCVGLHFGTYDYTASLGIAAAYQSLAHPAADHAKAVMQAAAAGTGAVVSDGSLNVLPVGGKTDGQDGLAAARPPGPAQPGTRLLPGLGPAPGAAAVPVRGHVRLLPRRLSTRPRPGWRATWTGTAGGVLDEPATARALASFLRRGLACGAVTGADLARSDGLAVLLTRSLPGRFRGGPPAARGPRRGTGPLSDHRMLRISDVIEGLTSRHGGRPVRARQLSDG